MTVGAIVTILSFYVQATPGIVISTPVLEIGWNFCTINVACLTAGTFLMFSCIKRSEVPRIITRLSKLSYGMYLMHIFWLHLWSVVSIQTLQLHSGGDSVHRGLHIRLLRPDLRTHLQASGQQMDHRGVKLRCFDKLSNHRACTQQQFVENKYLTGNYLNNPAPLI